MSSAKFLKIKAAIYEMALLFNHMPSDERITAYANALINFSEKQIIFAFKQVINSGSPYFPAMSEILKHLKTDEIKKEDRAPMIAREVLRAIKNFGQYDEQRMLESISEEAKATINALGGTSQVRNSENPEAIFAQLRQTALGVLSQQEFSFKKEKLERISSTGKVNAMTVDFSGYLEEVKA